MDRKQIHDLFQSIDQMDTEKFLTFLTENATFQFGNFPAVKGRVAIRAAVSNFFSSIKSLKHEIQSTWHDKHATICQGTAAYVRKDSRTITVPFCNVFIMKNNLINEYLIYVDVTPLFS